LDELRRIHAGKGTLTDLKSKYEKDSTNFSILFKLSQKYDMMGNNNVARKYIKKIINHDVDSAGTAIFYDQLYGARESGNPDPLIEFAEKTSDNEKQQMAYQESLFLLRRMKKQPKRESYIFLQYIGSIQSPTAGLLNNFAWRMTELEMNLDTALVKIDIALGMENKPKQTYMYLDTKAEVLWKLNRIEEALSVIEKCVKGEPDNKYYQEQKEKFLKSRV